MRQRLTRWMLMLLVASACVDPIQFDVPPAADIVVVDGSITDGPGPYLVKLSRALDLDADSSKRESITGAVVKLHSDEGVSESMIQKKPGEYWSGGLIRGTIGRKYHITIQLGDGTSLESTPEEIHPLGEITSIYHQYEARTVTKPFGVVAADVFNIYVNGNAPIADGQEAYVRWRFSGTYEVFTNPERHRTYLQGEFYYMTPWPCSGYIVAPAVNGGVLEKRDECTCCKCWVKEYESKPHLSDAELVENGQFRNIKVGEVPISGATFVNKYRVEVEQMTISRPAFEFFKLIREQKDAPSNIFQPAQGKLVGNIRSSNEQQLVVGIFWAASISRQSIFLHQSDLPYTTPQNPLIVMPCNVSYANSTTTKPSFWDE